MKGRLVVKRGLSIAALVVLAGFPARAYGQTLEMGPAIAAAAAEATRNDAIAQSAAPTPAFVYSDGYRTRAKIHKISSVTMVPLLATQGLLGRSLYNTPTQTKRDWHNRVAWGVGGLFAVNTVTGTMNLIEARKDPNGRKLRIAHAVLMLASDAGFLATAITAPESRPGTSFADAKSTHRAIAFTSVGTATLGYLLMLFGHK